MLYRHRCWVNTKKYVIQPGNIVLDPVKKPSPSQAITAKPPDLQPEKKKKRKKKKSKKRKTAEVVSDPSNEPTEVIADPCTQPGERLQVVRFSFLCIFYATFY